MSDATAWSTCNEKHFIDSLGTHGITRTSVKRLLECYIRAARKRTEWGDIIPEVAIRYAEARLRAEFS